MSTAVATRTSVEPTFDSRPRTMTTYASSTRSNNDSLASTPINTTMGPPTRTSPEQQQQQDLPIRSSTPKQHQPQQHYVGQSVSASQGPKVVQTAFIHKLYSMLSDVSISHLIYWAETGDSFFIDPTHEFAKVLIQYFKHTNISSFVRQLNMYGFHKISEIFHSSSGDAAKWEFRHGTNSFRRGELAALKEIKRRASRHTIPPRDPLVQSSLPKLLSPQPGTSVEPQDIDQRIFNMESMFYDMSNRLSRAEDNVTRLSTRCHMYAESISQCHDWIHQLSATIHAALPTDTSLRQDMLMLQRDVEQQKNMLRSFDQQDHVLPPGRSSYLPALDDPASPRSYLADSRRSSIQLEPPSFNSLRQPVPSIQPHYSGIAPVRRVSVLQMSPGSSRPPLPPPHQPHPLSNAHSPPSNLARRHTSADIREHGWPIPPNASELANASGEGTNQWQPSSPGHVPQLGVADESLQNQLASYQIGGSRRSTMTTLEQDTSPVQRDRSSSVIANNISWGPGVSKFPRPGFEMSSAPSTRRSSMVHSLLNPTAEEDDDNVDPMEDRKRKRLA